VTAFKMISLDSAGKAFSLGNSDYINYVATAKTSAGLISVPATTSATSSTLTSLKKAGVLLNLLFYCDSLVLFWLFLGFNPKLKRVVTFLVG